MSDHAVRLWIDDEPPTRRLPHSVVDASILRIDDRRRLPFFAVDRGADEERR